MDTCSDRCLLRLQLLVDPIGLRSCAKLSSGHLSGHMSADALSWLASYISFWQSVGVFSSANLSDRYRYMFGQMSAEATVTGRPNRCMF
jgi:hypothetical protein